MENRPPAPDDGHDPGVTVVVDTSVLLNLAKPVVDHENGVSGSTAPLKKVPSGYDIIAPQPVFAELSDQTQDKDGLLAAASQTVLRASNYIESIPPSDYPEPDDTTLGLDGGERAAISLAKQT